MSGSAVHGGDEINAIVLDPGSYYTRIGYAGDDYPKITTPSVYAIGPEPPKKGKRARIYGDAIGVPRTNHEVRAIVEDSLIVDWDAAIDQYKYYFEEVLKINYKEQPLLVVEPVWATNEYRQKLVETLFDSFDFPALYLAKRPTCVSFHQGRSNCLVVDIGHDSTSITPVVDGMSMLKNTTKTHYAGKYLNAQVEELLARKFPDADLCAKFEVAERTPTVYPAPAQYTKRLVPAVTDSYRQYQQLALWHEFKETLLEVPEKQLSAEKEQYEDAALQRSFELPLGQLVVLGVERFEIADALFDPANYPLLDPAKFPPNNGEVSIKTMYDDYRPVKRTKRAESLQSSPPPEGEEEVKIRGLSQLVAHTLTSVDIDLRASMAHNIIVTGGTSLVTQLTERIQTDLAATNPALKVRLHAVGSLAERSGQSWTGGSILASLGTFHQMWVSKEEYEQAGAEKILNQRFR